MSPDAVEQLEMYGAAVRLAALDEAVRRFLAKYGPRDFLNIYGIPYWAVNGIRANFARIIEEQDLEAAGSGGMR